MLFENRTKETIKVRVIEKTRHNLHGWRNVKPEKTIELDKAYGLRMKLTPTDETEAPKEDKNPNDLETPEDPVDDWKEEILAVKNVGIKTAEDIIAKYPSRESLIDAVNKKEHLPMKDDVATHFTEKYGEDNDPDN